MAKHKGPEPRVFRGDKVVDATQDLEISITKNDVTNSRKKDPNNCAAARAIKREYKCKEVAVFLSRTFVKNRNKWVRYITPASISREITSFDRGASFEPGEYSLKRPCDAQKLGYRPGGRNKTRTGTGKQRYHVTANIRDWKVSK